MEALHITCTIIVLLAGACALAVLCFGAYIEWYDDKKQKCSRCAQNKPLTYRVCTECYNHFKKRIGETW